MGQMSSTSKLAIAIIIVAVLIIGASVMALYESVQVADNHVIKTAMIKLPDGSIVEGIVENCIWWSEGKCEITIDSVTYTVHPNNLVIIKEEVK